MRIPLTDSVRSLVLILLPLLLAACQTMPAPKGFTPAQVATLKAEGFVETGDGWTLTINERLLFATNESALKPEQVTILEATAKNLVSVGILTARVEGHTDSTGTTAYNQTLSQARAQSVARALQTSGMRFDADQIIGRGETIPLSPNDTAEGRQDNRRVVVIVTPPA
ncbi:MULTISPECIES: OmpA family protein [unclassified Sphingopyxis]|uniref:OmpA family protein n=1 Tax=unclassified Sphingopyxis TaxID=2614943 RepID=UPI0007303203|nr:MULTISPECIES: OmpA family protein [unclassified Sphingopyxis]KTE28249.1 cell envelope biogenesis protein OmpA [Sphingopyxis sp. H057]KTE55369.1 cell envelope biogenesis protein OmpA [Sphingopyxis sp. H073]KTE57740.1 cell envelope biogenesis protein OmpA [Sphingopyxis sp. H071]KTE59785.1 cell envelope biogenesis protein OmpA [Sphingopyxis sp. H100]KTE61023.1 cell envelope biogenesis protein OmpA [Sphingopyxis sp. H107]